MNGPMASPPVNIFSQHCKPDEVLQALKDLLPNAVVETDEAGVWKSVKATWKRGWLKSSLELVVTHDPAYYSGDNWSVQRVGMAGYFRRFPNADQSHPVFGYLPGLAFVISFILQPGTVAEDPRQEIIHHIAKVVDGVIFLPGSLLDAEGRVLLAAGHESDPEARLPAHEPMAHTVGQVGSKEDAEAPPPAEPPSQERVVSRLIVMNALMQRGFLEVHPDGMFLHMDLLQELRESSAWAEVEPAEREELETPVGSLSEKSDWRLPWLSEGAAVLAWGLGLMELPPYDKQVDVDELTAAVDKLKDGTLQPLLRTVEEMDRLSFQMLAIHWRLRQFQVEPVAMDFAAFAPKAWCGPMDLSLARLTGNDLEIQGVPIAKAAEEDWKAAAGIMQERRMAIHWLLGHAAVYSENDTST